MRIWFNNKKADFKIFKSEKFLLLPLFNKEIIDKDKDFKNSKWLNYIPYLVEYSSLDEADIILYHDKLDIGIIESIQLALQHRKKVVAFYNDDNSKPSTLPDCVDLYRTSLYRSTQKVNEFSLPAWSEDFGTPDALSIRYKLAKPVIGFCGAYTHSIRQEAIFQLNNNTDIETNFIIRDNYWGGNIHGKQLREEYVENIINSDLILCCRGAGNFSYRLFETMSLGRIPIIVNTDIALPCEDVIDWRSISIWIDNVLDINKAIYDFWTRTSNADYIYLQKKIRQTYDQFISPAGFTQYLSLKYKQST